MLSIKKGAANAHGLDLLRKTMKVLARRNLSVFHGVSVRFKLFLIGWKLLFSLGIFPLPWEEIRERCGKYLEVNYVEISKPLHHGEM